MRRVLLLAACGVAAAQLSAQQLQQQQQQEQQEEFTTNVGGLNGASSGVLSVSLPVRRRGLVWDAMPRVPAPSQHLGAGVDTRPRVQGVSVMSLRSLNTTDSEAQCNGAS